VIITNSVFGVSKLKSDVWHYSSEMNAVITPLTLQDELAEFCVSDCVTIIYNLDF
jgi:hypothetical protein